MRGILSSTPLDLVDLFFNLQRLEIIEFRLVRLELCMELILASFFLYHISSSRLADAPFQGAGRCRSGTLRLWDTCWRNGEPTVSFLSKRTTLPPLSPVAR